LSTWLAAAAVLVLTAAPRYALMRATWPDAAPGDAVNTDNYDLIARRLYTHGEYGEYYEDSGFRYRARRSPAFPVVLATIYSVSGGIHPWLGLLANVGFDMTTSAMLFFYALSKTRRLAAAVAVSLVFAFWWPGILLAPYLMSEPLYAMFLFGGCLLAARSLEAGSARTSISWAMGAGVVWAMASLTRPGLFYFPFVWLLVAGLNSWRARRPTAVIAAAALLVAFVIVHLPWASRNARVLGTPVFTSTWGGNHMFQKNFVLGDYGTDRYLDLFPRTTAEYGQAVASLNARIGGAGINALNELDQDKEYMRAVIDTARHHKARFVLASLNSVPKLWLGTDFRSPPPLWTAFRGIADFALLLLAGAGVVIGLSDGVRTVWLPVALIAYFTALHAVSVPESRYVIPLIPMLLILGMRPLTLVARSRLAESLSDASPVRA
jgi:hypothetical protein